jgi:hypothetical protein
VRVSESLECLVVEEESWEVEKVRGLGLDNGNVSCQIKVVNAARFLVDSRVPFQIERLNSAWVGLIIVAALSIV